MQHEYHRVPVTAVSLRHHGVLLSAQGNLVVAYDVKRKVLLAACPAFDDQAIHGIIANNDFDEPRCLVWGGRWVRLICLRQDVHHGLCLEPGSLEEVDDWILDGAFSLKRKNHDLKALFITAHNAVLIASFCNADFKITSIIAGSNSILYCAHASWLSRSKCLIASGTAFGHVTVWSCTIPEASNSFNAECCVHYTFSAHEGSVFGLHLAPTVVAAALEQRNYVLASCSDDRSVRIWDISDLPTRSQAPAEIERQTGFRSQPDDHPDAPALLSKAMGHQSRIWHVRFFPWPTDIQGCQLVTFGEDASIISWTLERSLDNKVSLPFFLRQIRVEQAHSGKNLWAIACNPELHIAAGGADGAITWRVLTGINPIIQVETPPSVPGVRSDYYRAYGFISAGQLVATTDQGRILFVEYTAEAKIVTAELSGPLDSLRGYSTVASLADVIFFAGSDGVVFSFRKSEGKIRKILTTGRKIAGLFTQAESTDTGETPTKGALLVTNVGAQTATVCFLDTELSNPSSIGMLERSLSLPDKLVVTSFAGVYLDIGQILILGSRDGRISIYSLEQGCASSSATTTINAHQGDAVTCLLLQVAPSGHGNSFILFSTGRDGTYAGHMINLQNDRRILVRTIHQLGLPLANVEGIGFTPKGDLAVWGFRSKEFVAFNITTQQEFMTVDCGGVHRTWCFQIGDEGGTFVWTKASQLHWKTQNELLFQSLHAGGHGREIKSAIISPLNSRLIATGAEDTNIKLSLYDQSSYNKSFRCLHTLQKHNTGIQHLEWSSNGQVLFSSGGFEEFFVWQVTHNVPILNIGVVCASKHPRSGTSDLRVTHFSVREEATQHDEVAFSITMAYSDSSMRIWRYTEQSWSLLASGDYLSSCLTQCMHFKDASHLLTASTDGHLALWEYDLIKNNRTQPRIHWQSRYRLHQDAILCLAVHEARSGCQIVLTGGDDNAVGVTRVTNWRNVRSMIIPRAHAAAVTAIAVVHREPDRLWFVSASLEQRAKLWRVDLDVDRPGIEGINICLISNVFTAVADVSSMDSIQTADGGKDGVLICGVGMDVWKIDIGKT